jgi:putative protease
MREILAPAGDIERMNIAFLYGADAVYFGGQNFSLRANAKNFSLNEIKTATKFAHQMKKKVYVTVNIIFHNEDLKGLKEYLKYLDFIKVDGLIISDLAIVKYWHELNLQVPLILSTQESVLNIEAVKFWQSLGIKKIVLGREAKRDDIKEIIDKTGIEIECFIHGAMCTALSGECVLSNYFTNRDSNRGGCAQICRWVFQVDNKPDFTMMSKDLNMISNIKDMENIGISSYKIEGRMRSIYYLATVTLCYKRIFSGFENDSLTKKNQEYYLNVLNRCANRESKPQFYNTKESLNDEYWHGAQEITNQDFLGIVKEYDDNKKIAKIEARNYFEIGTEVQFFSPDYETFSYTIHNIKNENFENITIVNHPRMIIYLEVNNKLYINDMMRLCTFIK